jgi:D-glycero-D-manno-heptose 1,7-bisphosphate phosphatase
VSLTSPVKSQRVIFLDRDGVVNEAIVRDGRPYPPPDAQALQITRDAPEALAALADAGFTLIVVTNQPDVARGTQTRDNIERINDVIRASLPIHQILTCYHDDAAGCACRKPKPGLLLDAAEQRPIDFSQSYLIGDRWKDIAAGRAAGVRTVFIDFDYDERQPDPPADATVRTLSEAAAWILALETALERSASAG